ncbi:WXG100-like domain-containing protein [Actinomycetospora aurantiaca]
MEAVGLWWPAADEERLRAAAAAWDRTALDLERALEVGRAGAKAARAGWTGGAADRFAVAWGAHEAALQDDAAGCRALGVALLRFAEAVEDAKRRVTELAVTAGATLVAGAGLAWLTFGASAAVAAGVSSGLVAAAAAIGVELSATAATVLGGILVGAVFGAVESAAVDLAVTQPLRVEAFGDGGYSLERAGVAAVAGAGFGAVLGGARGLLAGPRPARTPFDDLGELDGRISAALDPSSRGALGPLFRPGVHESPGASFSVEQAPTARLLESEGMSVHARPGSGALMRTDAADRGLFLEMAAPEASSAAAVEAAVLESSGRLARQGGGHLVVDGRAVALDTDEAGKGLLDAVLRAQAEGLELPRSIRFVFEEGSIFWP